MDFLSKLRESTQIGEILYIDGHRSAPRISSCWGNGHDCCQQWGPLSLGPLPFINFLREVSSQIQAFQASPVTPDGTACGSALNAAGQISYWPSAFTSMMESSNPEQPKTTSLSTFPWSTLSTATTLSASPTLSTLASSCLTSPAYALARSTLSSHNPPVTTCASLSSNDIPPLVQQDLHPLFSFNHQSSRSVVNPRLSTTDSLPFGHHSPSVPPGFSASGCTESPFVPPQLATSAS